MSIIHCGTGATDHFDNLRIAPDIEKSLNHSYTTGLAKTKAQQSTPPESRNPDIFELYQASQRKHFDFIMS